MTQPQYLPTISLGNALTIAVLLASLVGNYYIMNHRVQQVEKNLEAITQESNARVQRFEGIASSYEGRIRAIEIGHAGQAADLRAITNGIQEIKAQLQRIESRE